MLDDIGAPAHTVLAGKEREARYRKCDRLEAPGVGNEAGDLRSACPPQMGKGDMRHELAPLRRQACPLHHAFMRRLQPGEGLIGLDACVKRPGAVAAKNSEM